MKTTERKPSYCLPIQATSCREVKKILARHRTKKCYDYYEIWLGAIRDLNDAFIQETARSLGSALIILFRSQALEVPISATEQLRIIRLVAPYNVLIDLDLTVQRAVLKKVAVLGKKVRLITSYHNYTGTPATTKLRATLQEMKRFAPQIYKISCFCKTPDDAVRLLQLGLALKKERKRYLLLGMGGHGTVTRTYGTLWGNHFIFAPKDVNSASAPGQLSWGELEQFFSTLR